MVGSLSSFFMGYFSDKYGRKTVCLIMSILMSLSIILSELFQLDIFNFNISQKYVIYFIFQFFLGFSINTIYYCSFILLLEITSARHNTQVSNLNVYFYVLGELVILIVSYLARDYHLINCFMIFFSLFIVFLLVFFVPESPRYLVTKKKYKEAYIILKHIALSNGREKNMMEEREFINTFCNEKIRKRKQSQKTNSTCETRDLINEKISFSEEIEFTLDKIEQSQKSDSVYFYLFKSSKNFLKTLLLAYIWIAISMIYYGVSLGIFINLFYLFNIQN